MSQLLTELYGLIDALKDDENDHLNCVEYTTYGQEQAKADIAEAFVKKRAPVLQQIAAEKLRLGHPDK